MLCHIVTLYSLSYMTEWVHAVVSVFGVHSLDFSWLLATRGRGPSSKGEGFCPISSSTKILPSWQKTLQEIFKRWGDLITIRSPAYLFETWSKNSMSNLFIIELIYLYNLYYNIWYRREARKTWSKLFSLKSNIIFAQIPKMNDFTAFS